MITKKEFDEFSVIHCLASISSAELSKKLFVVTYVDPVEVHFEVIYNDRGIASVDTLDEAIKIYNDLY